MDPLSPIRLTPGVESLALTAKVVVANLFRYFEPAKNAPEKSKELRREMHTICDVLESLNLVLRGSEHDSNSASLKKSISEFSTILNEINVRVNKMSTVRSWPFSDAENEGFLTKIARYKETFTMALTAISAYLSRLDTFDNKYIGRILMW